jgi:Lon protease-like protein
MAETRLLPARLPLFPLPGAILLPRESLPLNVFEPRYLNMIDDARAAGGHIGIIQIWPGGSPANPLLARIGTVGSIEDFHETRDGRYLIRLAGIARFAVGEEFEGAKPYRVARADYRPFAGDVEPRAEIDDERVRLTRLLQAWFLLERVDADWPSIAREPLASLVDRLSMVAPFTSPERQSLLEAKDGAARLLVMEDVIVGRLAESHGSRE